MASYAAAAASRLYLIGWCILIYHGLVLSATCFMAPSSVEVKNIFFVILAEVSDYIEMNGGGFQVAVCGGPGWNLVVFLFQIWMMTSTQRLERERRVDSTHPTCQSRVCARKTFEGLFVM